MTSISDFSSRIPPVSTDLVNVEDDPRQVGDEEDDDDGEEDDRLPVVLVQLVGVRRDGVGTHGPAPALHGGVDVGVEHAQQHKGDQT